MAEDLCILTQIPTKPIHEKRQKIKNFYTRFISLERPRWPTIMGDLELFSAWKTG
jgi:hypothetical protein